MPLRDVVGHTRMVGLLARAIARDTLPPSLLLAGPSGVGKRRVAVGVAAAINCLSPQHGELERDGCGTCTSCLRIARGVHPDVIVIVPGDTGTIKTEPIREVIAASGFRPFEGRRRVVVVDEADALVVPAQNALLKTLEEPPSASIFLLVSSMPDSLLATVRSRCPRLRFGPLSVAEVADVLVRDHGFSAADARVAADASDGSIGGALALQSADLQGARDAAATLLRQAARGADPVRRLEAAKALAPPKGSPASDREQLAACLRAMSSLLRDLGIMASRVDTGALANADLAGELEALSRSYDAKRSVKAHSAVDRALAALERNASPKVVADWLVLEL
ncbi:MAG TPA: DNA polymerase III subunit [Vicinamibacterales bacterium]